MVLFPGLPTDQPEQRGRPGKHLPMSLHVDKEGGAEGRGGGGGGLSYQTTDTFLGLKSEWKVHKHSETYIALFLPSFSLSVTRHKCSCKRWRLNGGKGWECGYQTCRYHRVYRWYVTTGHVIVTICVLWLQDITRVRMVDTRCKKHSWTQ